MGSGTWCGDVGAPLGAPRDPNRAQQAAPLRQWLGRVWWYIRQVSGDAAYENYLRAQHRGSIHSACGHSHAGLGNDQPLLSPREFYDDALRRRYSGISRCC